MVRIRIAVLTSCPLLIVVALADAQAPSRWRLVPDATFGSSDDPRTELTRVIGVEVAPDGRVLIQDNGSQSIRRFAPDGRFLDAVGRTGAGPGEFKSMTAFGRAPDGTLWINDPGNSRFSVHSPDGTFLKTVQAYNNDRLHAPLRIDRVGRRYLMVIRDPGDPNTPMGFQRRRPDNTIIDTVAIPSCIPEVAPVRIWRTPAGVVSVPLSHWPSEAFTDYATMWCSPGTPYTVTHFDLDKGSVFFDKRKTARTLPIEKSVRDSAITALRANLKRRNIPETAIDFDQIPRVQASVIGLAVDDERRVWVRIPAANGTEFDVYGNTGGQVAVVTAIERLDRSFPPVVRKDKVYAVVLDEDDVPTVVRFRIERFR